MGLWEWPLEELDVDEVLGDGVADEREGWNSVSGNGKLLAPARARMISLEGQSDTQREESTYRLT